jgi:hypothetical protein
MQIKITAAATTAAALGIGLLLATGAWAQPPADVTAVCKDGSSYTGNTRTGACRGHGGVATWGPAASTAAPAAGTAAPGSSRDPAKTTTTNAAPIPSRRTGAPVAGGGTGQVWVNTDSKVYHCPGDRYYGKTKAGSYMSESAAKAAGDRPAYGKACS